MHGVSWTCKLLLVNMLAPPFKAWVAGSNPAALTIVFGPVGRFHIAFFRQRAVFFKTILDEADGGAI
jgi:hypothetical protein